ncbi:hypothetical protein [Nocardioides sp.]|uniref:hypothetical protein n=1 Tax=Nocardioides sp. TaxID=35761 RepID=UPI0035B1BE9E
MNARLARLVPPGLTTAGLVLRVALFLLPCAGMAVALPERPHLLVVLAVVLCAGWWSRTPDHVSGAVAMTIVFVWWTVHDVLDWRVPVVAVLLLAAHVVATLLSYGPETMPVDPRLARLWLGRALLALVPLPVTWVALQGLDADLAPGWVWMAAALITVALIVVTLRLTRPTDESGAGSGEGYTGSSRAVETGL